MAKKIIPTENKAVTELRTVILAWKINQVMLAEKMDMPEGSFRNKLNFKQHSYQFTEQEIVKLAGILHEMMEQIKKKLVESSVQLPVIYVTVPNNATNTPQTIHDGQNN